MNYLEKNALKVSRWLIVGAVIALVSCVMRLVG
jgi:hypothetical protein